MLIELMIALLLGVLIGTSTGLFPGIHINLVGAFLVSISASYLYSIPVIYLVTFISAMAITHTFMDFIPSIFLGCPDADTSLSILPGHELLKEGEGYQAIMRTAYGGLYSVFLLVIFAFPLSFLVSKVYLLIQKVIPYILILVCITMVLSERKKFKAATVLILTGILGMCVLELNIKESLLPLLSGLFGSSMLLISINQNTKIPKQNITFKKLGFRKLIRPLSGALLASPLCGFLPGLGGGQAAVMGNQIARTDTKGFLVLLGAAVAIQSLMGNVNSNILILILCVCLISGILSFFLVKTISIKFLKVMEKVNYKKLSIGIIALLTVLILLISGLLGFLIFVISTATGMYCISLNVKKTQMMGCLLIPTIILYLI